MADAVNKGLATRLRRLPGQLLLALINGTAILVIVACVLALVAFAKVESIASDVAATMTDAILARVDVDPRNALAKLRDLATDVRGLALSLKDAKATARADLAAQIERLNGRLEEVKTNIARLADSRSLLIDDALAALSRSLADGLEKLSACRATTPGV